MYNNDEELGFFGDIECPADECLECRDDKYYSYNYTLTLKGLNDSIMKLVKNIPDRTKFIKVLNRTQGIYDVAITVIHLSDSRLIFSIRSNNECTEKIINKLKSDLSCIVEGKVFKSGYRLEENKVNLVLS